MHYPPISLSKSLSGGTVLQIRADMRNRLMDLKSRSTPRAFNAFSRNAGKVDFAIWKNTQIPRSCDFADVTTMYSLKVRYFFELLYSGEVMKTLQHQMEYGNIHSLFVEGSWLSIENGNISWLWLKGVRHSVLLWSRTFSIFFHSPLLQAMLFFSIVRWWWARLLIQGRHRDTVKVKGIYTLRGRFKDVVLY